MHCTLLLLIWINSTFNFVAAKTKHGSQYYFDLNAPDHETVLTPADFVAINELNLSEESNNTDNWYQDALYNSELFEGDIANDLNASTVALFLNGGPIEGQKDAFYLNAIRDRRQLWKNGRIPYTLSSQYSAHSRAVIASAMDQYAKHTCIRWTPRTQFDNDYVYILPERGCYSMVGRTGGRQILSLGQGCIQKGIIMHEMMHCTGFFHEQSRTDRDNYVQILWQNIQPGMQGQFEKYSSATTQTFDTQYDYGSILHYDSIAFSRNGQPTILPKINTQIGQRAGFSLVDIYKINRLYECVLPTSTTQTIVLGTRSTILTTSTSTTTTSPITISSFRKIPIVGVSKCVNKRPDCHQLYNDGWCQKNEKYMNDNCCGICQRSPDKIESGLCEDLRVDCLSLVKRRFCLLSPNFSREFCSKSCGFCPPIDKEIIDKSEALVQSASTTQAATLRTTTTTTTMTTLPSTTIKQMLCRDKSFKCVKWRQMGYCSKPMYASYMKETCPFSCKHCIVYTNP